MELTQIEQMLIEAIKAALRQESICLSVDDPEVWNDLFTLSLQHKLMPMVLNAVHRSAGIQTIPGYSMMKKNAKMQIMTQSAKTVEFLELYKNLCDRGITPLVNKGILCRELYPDGNLRQSSDEDLFVQEDAFSECCDALRELGYRPDTEPDDATYELGWKKQDGLLYIELHRSLFSLKSSAVSGLQTFFNDAFEKAETYPIAGNEVCSLCPHDHLLYLILHAFKHFIHSGFGIRQICDIGLWAKTYHDRIDWSTLRKQCEAVSAQKFAAAIFQIAEDELGIEISLPDEWADRSINGMPLLKDALCAGIYGSAEKSRLHSASVTFNAVAAENENKNSSLLQTIFPSVSSLENDYPILKKRPWMQPWIWCVRLWNYRKEIRHSEKREISKTLQTAKERKTLLQYYGIISS